MACSLVNGIVGLDSRSPANILGLLFAMLTLSGCIDLETVLRVNPDGTGTITERVVISKEIVGMIHEMAPEGQPAELYSEQELRDAAAKFGDGVAFLYAEDVETASGQGYIAHYEFHDINLVRIGQDPAEKMPGGPIEGGTAGDDHEYATFSLRPGYPAMLVIAWPAAEDGAISSDESGMGARSEGPSAPPEQQEAAMEMMRTAFRDMRMALHIEVAGGIVETNATHSEGNRVTLMEIEFAQFLENDEALQALAAKKYQSVADVKELMRLIPGIRLETEPQVNVLFE